MDEQEIKEVLGDYRACRSHREVSAIKAIIFRLEQRIEDLENQLLEEGERHG